MWHQSSFKQLSRVQMRQVGSLVTVALYDSLAGGSSNPRHTPLYHLDFLPAARTISGNEGVFNVQEFVADRYETARQVYNYDLSNDSIDGQDAFFRLTVASIPVVVSYPYVSTKELGNRLQVLEDHYLKYQRAESRDRIRHWTHAMQHILLRYLCECKNPIRNTSLEGICSPEICTLLDEITREEISAMSSSLLVDLNSLTSELNNIDTIAYASLRIFRFITHENTSLACGLQKLKDLRGGVIREMNEKPDQLPFIARFLEFVSIYIAVLLGSRFGARNMPCDLVQTVPDVDLVCSLALSIAQYTWNPNYVHAGVLPQS
ncbi:LRR-GTPase of the ROCO family [Perkinsela sp. CCAP 1560/4]|nr:LRR-GTPase of the ROCO family [Perkinsela sp. CCAP 1560/4]|eukprot:KNH09474.1 LRR-GTPase of the ROCO family [Perkinsela sp. CCAP 1560/4]